METHTNTDERVRGIFAIRKTTKIGRRDGGASLAEAADLYDEGYRANGCPRCGAFLLTPGQLSCHCGGPSCPLD